MAYQNAAGINVTGVVTLSSAGVPTGSAVTQHGVVVAGASNALSTVAPGTSGNVLTSNGTDWASSAAAGGGISTINGNSGSITGSTVTISSNTAQGRTIRFSNTSATSTFNVLDANDNFIVGDGAGGASITGNNNNGIGTSSFSVLTSGSGNTAINYQALKALTTGQNNTAIGADCLESLVGSNDNIGIGRSVLHNLTSGAFNCAVGSQAGLNYAGAESNNILLNSSGTAAESNVLRIGDATGTGTLQINSAFICGINGITVTGTAVLVSSSNQLGIAVSSKRFKENIVDMRDCHKEISSLRPVNFTINRKSAPGLEDAPEDIQYGLIAEEVHDVMPYLCYYDKDGLPLGVKYDQLPVMLLQQIQIMQKQISALQNKLGI